MLGQKKTNKQTTEKNRKKKYEYVCRDRKSIKTLVTIIMVAIIAIALIIVSFRRNSSNFEYSIASSLTFVTSMYVTHSITVMAILAMIANTQINHEIMLVKTPIIPIMSKDSTAFERENSHT